MQNKIKDGCYVFVFRVMRQFGCFGTPTFLSNIHVKLAIHFSLEDMLVKNYLYLSKLAAQAI
jgi:hypothetical protein